MVKKRREKNHHLCSYMEASMLLRVGLNIGCLSFLIRVLTVLPSVCWLRVKVMLRRIRLLVLSRYEQWIPGACRSYTSLLCASIGGLVWRYLFSKPVAAFKVTRSLAAKAFMTDLPLCRETFFSAQMDDTLVERYQKLMKESSRLPLFDLRKLNASLPVPVVPESSIQVLVVGARDDFIVDAKGLDETGKFYGVSPICVEGVAHDMMLDCSWEKGANVILSWLSTL